MPLPRALARLNRVGLNRIVRYLAGWFPGQGIVVHTGRRSGRVYRTPVTMFRREGGYAVALTYGRQSDWVRNVLAAGGCRIVTRGREVRVTNPRIVRDERRALARPVERVVLGWLRVSEFVLLDPAPDQAGQPPASRPSGPS